MSDTSVFSILLQHYQNAGLEIKQPIIVLDENNSNDISQIAALFPFARIVTNRWDIYQLCLSQNLQCEFSDFAFSSASAATHSELAIYRISKERAVSHYVLNQLFRLINHSGKVLIGGRKNEGIKNYFDKCKKTFNCTGALIKDGDIYTAILENHTFPLTSQLDDKQYTEIRQIETSSPLDDKTRIRLYSKPGLYGWDKADKGSEFLVQTVWDKAQDQLTSSQSLLDLGCGFGYLSYYFLMALRQHSMTTELKLVHATDNNAASVICCEKNLQEFTGEFESIQITADDCGSALIETFDTVVCNPPFHQGFATNRDLTHKFLRSSKRLLKAEGKAYFVVNGFIPLEKLAEEYKFSAKCIGSNRQFKVIELQRR